MTQTRRFSPVRTLGALGLLLSLIPSSLQAAPPTLPEATAQKIRAILEESVHKKDTLGVVGGVVTPEGTFAYGTGLTSMDGGTRPNGDTLFEIGSLSKIFLDLLLEQEILKGKVAMDDPVVRHLPPDMPFPKYRLPHGSGFASDRHPKEVTLWNLATHTSGFPTMPARVDLPKSWNPDDPSNVTLEMAREFLKRFVFTRQPGTVYEYSNINTALIGYILSLKEDQDLETLLTRNVLGPFGMKDTVITLEPSQKARLAKGYTSGGDLAGVINTPMPFSGGGSLRSSLNDLMRFSSKVLELSPNPLSKVTPRQFIPIQREDEGPERTIGYFYYPQPFGDVFLIRSRTLGFRCCIGFIPSKKIGVVIMGNCMRFNTPGVFQAILETLVGQKAKGEKTFYPVD